MNQNPFNKISSIPFEKVEITDKFWATRQKINREVSILLQHQKLEENHHIDNFRVAAGLKKGITKGLFYLDSDLYKWMEAVSYSLQKKRDPKLEEIMENLIELIAQSQTKDGYVNTYYTTKFFEKRFTNIHITHEDYCAGHLIQAAIAHFHATGNEKFLNIAKRFGNLLVKVFLDGKKKGAPGHEEIEMALVELYRVTNNKKYLDLAKEYIDRRGNIAHFKTYAINQYLNAMSTLKKAKKIEERFQFEINNKSTVKKEKSKPPEYAPKFTVRNALKLFKENINGKIYQMNVPLRNATEPVGHSVRAMYLYCGMADLYSETGEKSLLKALERIWLKMTKARMYITGGIGSIPVIEGFGRDFQLDNENSYSETCAAIGNAMWNLRMLNITGKCKYADLIEKLLYNGMLSGQSIDGKSYFYRNPMISLENYKRTEWFVCACCPPNVARTIGSLGKYIYGVSEKGLWVHQYITSETRHKFQGYEIVLHQESGFPWNGKVKIKIELNRSLPFSLRLRIPIWSKKTELSINNEKYQDNLTPGRYIEIIRNWNNNDIISLSFKMEPQLETTDVRVKGNIGKVAISNGPIVYCLEQLDNPNMDIFEARIAKNPDLQVKFIPNLLDGVNIIEGKLADNKSFKAIPYYAWGNRGPSKMQVWNLISA